MHDTLNQEKIAQSYLQASSSTKSNMPDLTAIGLMSGTSADGIDVALIRTNGSNKLDLIDGFTVDYEGDVREAIRQATTYAINTNPKKDVLETGQWPEVFVKADRMITNAHLQAVNTLLSHYDIINIDLIGFHGQTILHRPELGYSLQLGSGIELAKATGIDVVYDFRNADISAGGNGAPLVPVYHLALQQILKIYLPCVFINIGGVANITWIGKNGELLAFDTGPGNALVDDYLKLNHNIDYDESGNIASNGKFDEDILKELMSNSYFDLLPPKSLDRNSFIYNFNYDVEKEDAVSTLVEFTSRSIAESYQYLPELPIINIICGGGGKNLELVRRLKEYLPGRTIVANDMGINIDTIEAEAFAYLAVMSNYGINYSFPNTTGCMFPVCGGKIARGKSKKTAANLAINLQLDN